MKKIIVPIDFSEHSEYALKTAAKLAKINNTKKQFISINYLSKSSKNLSKKSI